MRYRLKLLILALTILILSQISCNISEPDMTKEARNYVNGIEVIPLYSRPISKHKFFEYYFIRNAWDNRDSRLFDYLTEDELRMFEAILHLSEGQVLLAFKELREMQREGYPRARVLQRAALFLEHSPHEGSEAAGLEAVRADREAPEPVLTDDEIYYLFLAFPGVSGDKNFPGMPVTPASRFVSVFPHERATERLLESDEYMAGIERSPLKTFTVTAPGEPIDIDDLVIIGISPYLIDDAVLTEVLNRVLTGEPVSQQSIAIALSAYADPSRRDTTILNLLLDELGDLDNLIDIDEVLQYSLDVELIVAPWYLLEAVIRSGYYAGRYEISLYAFERLLLLDGARNGERSWFIELYLYGAASAAGLGDLERAYALLKEYLRYATIYHVPPMNVDINDYDSIEAWHDALDAEAARMSRDMDAQWDHLDIFHALVWYYLIAREFDAFIDTPYDTKIENLFASRFELSDVDFVAHDGRSGPSEKLIAAYERVAAEQK